MRRLALRIIRGFAIGRLDDRLRQIAGNEDGGDDFFVVQAVGAEQPGPRFVVGCVGLKRAMRRV